tara:strand:+ start:744 stop:932 length:189 start_codon:yes stop_codon:yes gene_type:complete
VSASGIERTCSSATVKVGFWPEADIVMDDISENQWFTYGAQIQILLTGLISTPRRTVAVRDD